MRIAHVTAKFPPYLGGTGMVCHHNARTLAQRGHDVHVFTSAHLGAPALEPLDGVTVHRLRPLVAVGNAPILPQLLPALRGFDLIHLHCPFLVGAELTRIAAGIHRTPLVATYHNDLVRSGSWRDAIFRLATWSCRNVVLRGTNQALFVSQGHADTNDMRELWRRRPKSCRVLPNGVDTTSFCPSLNRAEARKRIGLPASAGVVGFVGGLDDAHHYKGLDVLLTAIAMEPLSGVHLLVVGDGSLRQRYEQQATRSGLTERVHFHGAAGHDTLPSLYQACDVISLPSLAPESFSLVVVESLACGVPVVASECPGLRSVVPEGAGTLLVTPGNASELAASLHTLLTDEAWCRELGRRGRAQVESTYSWDQVGRELEDVYGAVVAAARREVRT